MAVFSPQMESQIYYERPVQEPRHGSVLGDSLSLIADVTKPSKSSGGTADQRFDKAWSSYEELLSSEDDSFDTTLFSPATATKKQLDQFGQLFGESLKNKALTYARDQQNVNVLTYEAEVSGQMKLETDWLSSAEYGVAKGTATRLVGEGKEDEAYLFLETARTDWITRKAASARLAQEAQNVTDLTKLSDNAWEVNKKSIRATTDFASYALTELLMALKATPNAEVNLRAELGDLYTLYPNITTEVVTRDNFSEFATQLKSEILRNETNRISGEVQFDLRGAPTGYENEVFGTIDTVVAWAEKDLDPAEIAKRGKTDAYMKMKEAGLPVDMLAAIDIFSTNLAVQTKIIETFTPEIIGFLEDYKNSGSAAAQERLRNMATQDIKDAKKHFTTMIQLVSGRSPDAGVYPEVTDTEQKELLKQNLEGFFSCLEEEKKRTGGPRLNKNVYEQCIEPNSADIVQLAAKDGAFASQIGSSIANDIMVDITKIKGTGVRGGTSAAEVVYEINDSNQIVFSLGMESVAVTGAEDLKLQAAFLEDRYNQFKTQELNALNDSDKNRFQQMANDAATLRDILLNNPSIPDVNYKLGVLSQLGFVGDSGLEVVKQELGIGEQEVESRGPTTRGGERNQGIEVSELPDAEIPQITLDDAAEVGTQNNPHNLTTREQVDALPAGSHFTFAGSVDASGNLKVYVK